MKNFPRVVTTKKITFPLHKYITSIEFNLKESGGGGEVNLVESAGEEGAIDVPARSGGERRRHRRRWFHFQPKQNP